MHARPTTSRVTGDISSPVALWQHLWCGTLRCLPRFITGCMQIGSCFEMQRFQAVTVHFYLASCQDIVRYLVTTRTTFPSGLMIMNPKRFSRHSHKWVRADMPSKTPGIRVVRLFSWSNLWCLDRQRPKKMRGGLWLALLCHYSEDWSIYRVYIYTPQGTNYFANTKVWFTQKSTRQRPAWVQKGTGTQNNVTAVPVIVFLLRSCMYRCLNECSGVPTHRDIGIGIRNNMNNTANHMWIEQTWRIHWRRGQHVERQAQTKERPGNLKGNVL